MMFAVLAVVAMPQAVASEFRPHGLSIGGGNHQGWFGVGYTLRGAHWGVHGGIGAEGWALQGRYHPLGWRPLYLSGGISPLIAGTGDSIYGPDVGVGFELAAARFGVNAGLGMGLVADGFDQVTSVATLDIALVINIGKRRTEDGPVEIEDEDEAEDEIQDVPAEAEVDQEALGTEASLEAARAAFEAAEAALQQAEAEAAEAAEAAGVEAVEVEAIEVEAIEVEAIEVEAIEVEAAEVEAEADEVAPPAAVIRPAADDE